MKLKLCLLSLLAFSLPVQATLTQIGTNMVYDSELKITWYKDANIDNNKMNWTDAKTWVSGLTLGGTTGWRLPGFIDPSVSNNYILNFGEAKTSTELGYLFNKLGGLPNRSIVDTHNSQYALFDNLGPFTYWIGTETSLPSIVGTSSSLGAWVFNFGDGKQDINAQTYNNYIWAVHAGEVQISAVPLPSAAWFLGSALLGILGWRRKKSS